MRQASLILVALAVFSVHLRAGQPTRATETAVVGLAEDFYMVPPRPAAGPQGQIWRQTIERPGAAFVKVHFSRFNLHPGDELRIYSGSGRLIETLTAEGPRNSPGSFWSLSAFGEVMVLELETRWPYRQYPFRVDQVITGDPELLRAAVPLHSMPGETIGEKSVCDTPDFESVACYDDNVAKRANTRASVGVMTAGSRGALFCSGANVSPLNYVLTNYHCIHDSSECADAEFVFRYRRLSCDGPYNRIDNWFGFRCDTTVALSSNVESCEATPDSLDFSLNSVIGDPAAAFGFARPDPVRLTSGENIYIVQHPAGRPQEITHGGAGDVVVDPNPAKSVIRYYGPLDTDVGSSGSPIFRESDHRMVGLHHCGGCSSPELGNRGMLMSDIYPLIEEFLCTESVALAPLPIEVTEVLGNGNGVLDPGETYQFVPAIRNRSCSQELQNVKAGIAISESSAAVVLLSSEVDFGDIDATGTATSSPIQFVVGEDACGGEIVLDLVDISAEGLGHLEDQLHYVTALVGGALVTDILTETFDGGIPSSWTVMDGNTGEGLMSSWTTENLSDVRAMTAPFAIAGSGMAGSGHAMDVELVIPSLDLSGRTGKRLRFAHVFDSSGREAGAKADVDLRSVTGGGTWIHLLSYGTESTAGVVEVDLTPYAFSDVEIRFRYHGAQDGRFWAVDNVTIQDLELVCEPFRSIFIDDFESGNVLAWSTSVP